MKFREYASFRPAYAVVDGRLLMSNYEPALLAMLDALRNPRENPPLSSRVEVRDIVARAPRGATHVLLADLGCLCAAPNDRNPGSLPRGWHWDQRNTWVWHKQDIRALLTAQRRALGAAYEDKHGRPPSSQAELAVQEEALDAFHEAELARYPEYVETYRKQLRRLSRLRFLALIQSHAGDVLRSDITIHLDD